MSRTKSDKPRVKLNFRVPAELLDRMEAWHRERRERLALEGVDRWTMTDSICQLIQAGLEAPGAPRARPGTIYTLLDTPARMRHK